MSGSSIYVSSPISIPSSLCYANLSPIVKDLEQDNNVRGLEELRDKIPSSSPFRQLLASSSSPELLVMNSHAFLVNLTENDTPAVTNV